MQRRSRSIDMRSYWVRDRVQQGQFIIYWKPGTENRGGFIQNTIHLHIVGYIENFMSMINMTQQKVTDLVFCKGVLIWG